MSYRPAEDDRKPSGEDTSQDHFSDTTSMNYSHDHSTPYDYDQGAQGPTSMNYPHDHSTSEEYDQGAQGDDTMDLSGTDTTPQVNPGPSTGLQPQPPLYMPRAPPTDAARLEQVTRLSARYDMLQDTLLREESNLKCCERKLAASHSDLDLQFLHEGTGRIIAVTRSAMKDTEKRIRELCQVLQLPAEDFVTFTDVT
jgi:hypothetical protein